MASFYARLAKETRERGGTMLSDDLEEYSFTSEGVEAYVEYIGSVEEVVNRIVAGLKAGMAYIGARTIKEIGKKAKFVRITQSGLKESYPHDIHQM